VDVRNFLVCFLFAVLLNNTFSLDNLVGKLTPLSFPQMEVNKEGKIVIGTLIENCGLTEMCKNDEFPIHVYTGKDNNDEPKICVDGKYFISKGINDAGRGLNIVVISNGKQVIRTGHFDTWQEGKINTIENQFLYLFIFL
jgi:hypothetical protein